ncbi:MAG: hypothetical protein QXY20_07075 [Thermofilum sp.]|uniref:hypothetical protein n=1 Tax=Thermofilum sp. TaxID=1961369 RepID=UPI003160091E
MMHVRINGLDGSPHYVVDFNNASCRNIVVDGFTLVCLDTGEVLDDKPFLHYKNAGDSAVPALCASRRIVHWEELSKWCSIVGLDPVEVRRRLTTLGLRMTRFNVLGVIVFLYMAKRKVNYNKLKYIREVAEKIGVDDYEHNLAVVYQVINKLSKGLNQR